MRKYQPIWEQLKANSFAVIVAPVASHQTIVNMVTKEKLKDIAWKLACAETYTCYRLTNRSDVKKETLTFTLKRSIKLTKGNL
jgi:hypothetical protein